MKVKFWGVRGSTPTPQMENMRYGGNTSCVELRLNDALYILDCGTGFRNLGKHLAKESSGRPLYAHIFLSHFHWDHIQGIPFFKPLYDSVENHFFFHASSCARNLQQALENQMIDPYFPVDMTEMSAQRNFYSLDAGRSAFDDCTIQTMWLNHPQGCLGFRVETPDGIVVYATDTEPGHLVFDRSVRKLAEGADLLIYDAQYLPDEYEARCRGWGHSHWREAVSIASDSHVKQLILYHHDPDHDDACVDEIQKVAQDYHPNLRAAYEGLEIDI